LTPFIASEKNQRHENFIFSNSFWSSVDRRPIVRAGNHPIASECDESKRGSTRAQRPADMQKMMAQMMELAKLNENHKLLGSLAGTWTYDIKMWMNPDPNAPP
jgi:hypothetical protein